jgi:hypothetical protein
MIRNLSLATGLALVLGSSASAQVLARGLIKEGDAPAGAPVGHLVTSIGEPNVNHASGFAVGLSTSNGVTTLSHFWGTPAFGGVPAVFRTEDTINNFVQNSFEAFWGYSNTGEACYSPLGNNLNTGGTSLDAAWLDDVVLAEEDQPIPSLPGRVWRFASRPGVTGNGIPHWVGGMDDAMSGVDLGYGLFVGVGATPLLKSGDVPTGAGGPIDVASGIDFDYRMSALGTHSIVPINTSEATTIDNYMVVDGAVLTVGGPTDLVQEGKPIPASAGGNAGELWSFFDFCGITESGEWFFTGDSAPSTIDDEIVVKNGQILYREGQTLDGEVLAGSIEDAHMNEWGHIAYIWDVVNGVPATLEALYLDDRLLLKQGQAVDLDGDGVVEPTSIAVNLSDVTIGYDNTVYLNLTVDVNGTSSTTDDLDTLLRIECVPVQYGIGKLNSVGQRSVLSWSGEPSLTVNDFALEVSDLSPEHFGLAVYADLPAETPFGNHFLYVGPTITRILPPSPGTPSGAVSVPIPIDMTMVGTLRCFQYWQRDPFHPDGTGVELSNGLSVIFCP